MNSVSDFIESGILELYVLGNASSQETLEVEILAGANDDVKRELNEITHALEQYAQDHAVEPDPMVRPMLMASIAYQQRLKNGEEPSFPTDAA